MGIKLVINENEILQTNLHPKFYLFINKQSKCKKTTFEKGGFFIPSPYATLLLAKKKDHCKLKS